MKDQRIVNLMMSRHEEEERARKERLMLELEWDEQRKIEEQMKKARQQQRQAEIWDTYKAKDSKQVSGIHCTMFRTKQWHYLSSDILCRHFQHKFP